MNEIFKTAFYISGTICFVTVTFAALKSMTFLKALFSAPPPTEPVGIDPVPTGLVEQLFETTEAGNSEPLVGLECGQCHNEIKTAPVNVEGEPPYEKAIYRCEHCGTDVAIPT